MSWQLQRHPEAVEEMDRPDCDPQLLRRTYAQFPLVNRVVAGWRGNYLQFIRPLLRQRGAGRILDIGCGGGDIAANLVRWAQADGLEVQLCAIDPDPRAISFARDSLHRQKAAGRALEFRQAHSSQLVAEGERFDVVYSNHLLHHLDPAELQSLQADTEQLCTGIGLHSDIRRSAAALGLFGAATLPLAGTSLIRRDGLASIRRSYTQVELAGRTRPGWQVHARTPYRNLLLWKAGSRG